jgi:hypothetical protein
MLLSRLLFVFFCLWHLGTQQASIDETKVWGDFLEWLKKQPAMAASALIPQYRPQLIASGLSETQAGQYISIVERLAKEKRLELDAIDFDKYYLNDTDNFSKTPNAFLMNVISDLKPGRALDVAMGQGRNAVFLAQKDWDVTGYDIATEGMRLARQRAEKSGLKITTIRATHQDFDFGKDRWDLGVGGHDNGPMFEVRNALEKARNLVPA